MIERELRLMSQVSRWQIVSTTRKPNIAEHSWFVTIISWRLVEDLGIRVDLGEVLREAACHDIPEMISGDVPSPVLSFIKADSPGWRAYLARQITKFLPWYREEPSAMVKAVVSVADRLEATLFLLDEMSLGNTYVIPHYEHLRKTLFDAVQTHGAVFGDKTDEVIQWVAAALDNATKPARVVL